MFTQPSSASSSRSLTTLERWAPSFISRRFGFHKQSSNSSAVFFTSFCSLLSFLPMVEHGVYRTFDALCDALSGV